MEKEKLKKCTSLSEKFRQFEKSLGFKNDIKWDNLILITLYHVFGVYWCYHYAFPVKWQTLVFGYSVTVSVLFLIKFYGSTSFSLCQRGLPLQLHILNHRWPTIMYVATGFGVTGGAHRLWTHKAYKVKLPLKLFMLILYSSAGQNSLLQWVRDHRVHHKFSDTEADPHNANRGLFFSHIGWLMMKKNEEVLRRGKQIDMSDIENDPVLKFYNRHFNLFKLLFCYILPTTLGVWLWDENWRCAVAWQCFIRYLSVFHSELTVNSLAHTFGYKPYNKNIMPAENRFVSTCSLGEGWHNYHHAFPFDYKAAEHFDFFNFGSWLIRFFSKMGWAYDLKEATPEMINSIADRLGDGTPVWFPLSKTKNEEGRCAG